MEALYVTTIHDSGRQHLSTSVRSLHTNGVSLNPSRTSFSGVDHRRRYGRSTPLSIKRDIAESEAFLIDRSRGTTGQSGQLGPNEMMGVMMKKF